MIQAKWIGCAAENFMTGRRTKTVTAIVIHLMDGSLTGTDQWFKVPPKDRGLSGMASSAHYGIGKDGTLHQYVLEKDTAYHAGRVDMPTWAKALEGNPNFTTIGIEHEGRPADEWPETMVLASAELVADIATRHAIPIDREHIVGHREIYSKKSCPGPHCPLDRIVHLAKAFAERSQSITS